MTRRVLKFTRMYNKLKYSPFFFTIRKGNKSYAVGDNYEIKLPGGRVKHAVLIGKIWTKLKDVSTNFLLDDTDCKTREEAIGLFRSFYRDISVNDPMFILVFMWAREDRTFMEKRLIQVRYDGKWEKSIEFVPELKRK